MPGRKLGQHFLINHSIADRIADACRLAPDDDVVEIGPGKGFLTEHLVKRPGRHRAVELDEALIEDLKRRFGPSGWSVDHADFLAWEAPDLSGRPVTFVGNLPYNASAPILRRILGWSAWKLAVVMLQKEVAERVLAGPGSRDYGLLSLAVQVKAFTEPVCDVSRFCFRPPPKVESMVVRLTPLPQSRLPEGLAEERFFAVARAAFSQRRKMIVNPLAAGLHLGKDAVLKALGEAGIEPGLRAEDVDLESYIRLARALP